MKNIIYALNCMFNFKYTITSFLGRLIYMFSRNSIGTELSQKIVDSIKSVVDVDINFINTNGIIIASTDAARIGSFHEVALDIVHNKSAEYVVDEGRYNGVKKGINYPIFHENQVIAVIGMTGEPKEIEKYGFIITKICEVFIMENEIERKINSRKELSKRLVTALIYNNSDNIDNMLEVLNINEKVKYAVINVSLKKNCSTDIFIRFENEFIRDFESYTYNYPNEYILLINEKEYLNIKIKLDYFANSFKEYATIGIGTLENIRNAIISYSFSKYARRYADKHENFYAFSEECDLEIFLSSVDTKVIKNFQKKIYNVLTDEEKQLLQLYFENNCSLKLVSESLFIHKNTVQYKLSQIKEKTGIDPRQFKDAVSLYIGLYEI
jgi:carbohydrate diacid regulator